MFVVVTHEVVVVTTVRGGGGLGTWKGATMGEGNEAFLYRWQAYQFMQYFQNIKKTCLY